MRTELLLMPPKLFWCSPISFGDPQIILFWRPPNYFWRPQIFFLSPLNIRPNKPELVFSFQFERIFWAHDHTWSDCLPHFRLIRSIVFHTYDWLPRLLDLGHNQLATLALYICHEVDHFESMFRIAIFVYQIPLINLILTKFKSIYNSTTSY